MGRAAAPISCGENGPWPQSGSRAGVWWATQGRRGPERVQENMQSAALKRQRLSFLVLCSEVQAENVRIDMLNGCKERNSFQQVPRSENFSPR